ncbi:hypothetical protein K4A83_11120 [Spirulina subsalsa FACHB-351]|uniref:Uncharacterized protein n=1 Tax=Spirulina subsalsa FACHB-351 TaxID=234711 RepID=A0ABT3L5P4_9CYAN|nr:hypothetical protein [Spirulina subsalsa]MCW6036808.1 hypothetical protein [Spirulina subsalsa FACHB-351]
MTDLKSLTDDDLHEMITEARAEQRRRKEEKKLPVFLVDGCYYKSLREAVEEHYQDVLSLKNKSDEDLVKYLGKYLTDGVDRTRFAFKIEFWSESEYNARPDHVWGPLN